MIPPTNNSPDPHLVVRTFPDIPFEPLRYQVGRLERQTVKLPQQKKADRQGPTTMEVQVYRLLGFGSTEDQAKAMARRALAHHP